MTKLILPTVSSIEKWASSQDVQFVGGHPELPYIKALDRLFYYFKLSGRDYELVMSSLHDLESF